MVKPRMRDRLHDRLEAFTLRRSRGINPSLEVIRRLLERLGHPEQAFGAVHVAGTNGKGSVCAMLEAILRSSGTRTGLYTSPHLRDFRERIVVDGEPADADRLAACLERVEEADRETGLRPATFFEAATAAAFLYFREAGVATAVLETGMGGRWDATNICRPDITVITPVGVDHTDFLGSDLGRIAWEKSGIMKPDVPVVVAPQEEAAAHVIRREAELRGSPLVSVDDVVRMSRVVRSDLAIQVLQIHTPWGAMDVRLPLAGSFQRTNCLTAIAAAAVLSRRRGGVTPDSVVRGLERVRWPGRLQLLRRRPPVIADGAHNVAAARALAAALSELIGRRRVALVAGFLRDKDVAGIARELAPLAPVGWCVRPRSDRALDAGDAVRHVRRAGIEASATDLETALAEAQSWAAANRAVVLVTGSLYLVAEILELMAAEPEPAAAAAAEDRRWPGSS